MRAPLGERFVAEISRSHGEPDEVFFDVEGEDAAIVSAVAPRATGLWAGIGLTSKEWHCRGTGPEATFRWSLHRERQGTQTGLVLALLPPGSTREARDPLWTVGTLGRERLELPEGVVRGDPGQFESAFVTREGDVLRVRRDGEAWAQLQSLGDEWLLRLWDSRALGSLRPRGEDRFEVEVHDVRSDLELSLLEAAPLAWAQ